MEPALGKRDCAGQNGSVVGTSEAEAIGGDRE
jgi:hypothetical protein